MIVMMMMTILMMMTIIGSIMIVTRTSIIMTVIAQPSRPIPEFLASWPAAPAGGARLPQLTSGARGGAAAGIDLELRGRAPAQRHIAAPRAELATGFATVTAAQMAELT